MRRRKKKRKGRNPETRDSSGRNARIPRPVARIKLSRGSFDSLADFSPLATPRDIQVLFQEVVPALLERLQASVAVDLEPGSYRLPLFSGGEVLPVAVPPDCRCHAMLSAERTAGDGGETTVLNALELSFDKPVVLGNILPVLTNLQTYFSDHDVTALIGWITSTFSSSSTLSGITFIGEAILNRLVRELKERLPAQPRWSPLVGQLTGGLTRTARQAATVSLSRVSARPVKHGDEWRLELRFTGEWNFFGRYQFPFFQVKVHPTILPSPHAALDQLLSDEPLASARMHREKIPILPLVQELATMVSTYQGSVAFSGNPPNVAFDLSMADGGRMELDVESPERGEVEASFVGSVAYDVVEMQVDAFRLSVNGHTINARGGARIWTDARPSARASDTAIGRCVAGFYAREWSSENLGSEMRLELAEGSGLPALNVRALYEHPLMKGETKLELSLGELSFAGNADVGFGGRGKTEPPEAHRGANSVDLRLTATMEIADGSRLDDGTTQIFPKVRGAKFAGRIQSAGPNSYVVTVDATARGQITARTRVEAFPEFSIEDGELITNLKGALRLDGRVVTREEGRNPVEADFSGTSAEITLARATLDLGERRLSLPEKTALVGNVTHGVLAASGLGRATVDFEWNMQGQSPLLRHKKQQVVLFVPELRQGAVAVNISPAGGISVSGGEWGLYDAHYWNALLNPEQEPKRIFELLSSDEALDHVFAALEVFSPDVVRLLTSVRRFARKAKRIFDEEGIEQPRDAIPGRTLARLVSRLVFDSTELEGDVYPIVKRVTDGAGLDVAGVKRLLTDHYPDHEYDFEVDRMLRLAARMLGPAEPLPRFKIHDAAPLAESAAYLERYAPLPNAAALYKTVDADSPLPAGFSATVAAIAPYLTLEQVACLVDKGREDWGPENLARLRHVLELKRRISTISQGYGGVGFTPQATAIAFFLGETIRRGRRLFRGIAQESTPPSTCADVPYPMGRCLLGPEDVAILLHAGLAAAWSGRAVQLNQRMLLDLVLEQPPEFLRDVLVELGNNNPRVLTAALNGLLELPQTAMREPFDLVALFSERLGFEFPRIDDFLAGGRRAKHSYYETLSETADQVLSQAEPYRALKYYLQEVRLPVSRGYGPTPRRERLAASALEAVQAADAVAGECTFKRSEPARRERARAAYREAFAACTTLLRAAPHAFQLDWFKEFWARNHEALVLLSVVRNVQEGIDDVARWLSVRSGRKAPASEQRLVDTVIDALYYYGEDRERLSSDPLVRLLIDPPEQHYNFTVISAMGVITGGAKGTELEEAYRRLEERRGIRVIRADTATARSLEYNAERIIEAVRSTDTPWGYIGYSQGCPNGLMAESKLAGGPPVERRLLRGLVCRNLLFSAFNASAHGTCGDKKFLEAMVYLDHFLAHYQTMLSGRAIQLALGCIRLGLDSRQVVLGMMGSRSLSAWGVLGLHRGGQFKDTAPTSILRGIVEPDILPEALEFLSNVLGKQLESTRHDTQVSTDEALGHSILVDNAQTREFARCDMGCMVQRTHHWSPLKEDTEFVTTERDVARAVYDLPKDRHVFPWIEVNARFGLIRPK